VLEVSFTHIDKRDDQPNSIYNSDAANNQMDRTTEQLGPIIQQLLQHKIKPYS